MTDFFRRLFDTSDFPARWFCGNWSSFDGWVLILSDLAIFGAYFAIPFSISFYILAKRREVIFPKLYWLFAAFILSCGLTHLVDALIFWQPWYRVSGLLKFLTAVVSWVTAIVLIRSLPTALALPGTARLNVELQREIEERKRSEAAHRESSTRLSLAIQHSKLGDWWWDAATDVTALSPRALEIFGHHPGATLTWEELRGRLHQDDRERARLAVEQSVADRTDYDIEYRVIRPGKGEEAWISARGRAEYHEDGRVWRMIGTVQDITERKRLESDREHLLASERAARAEAERANRIKDEFLATLSHELRTPLHAILGWSHLLRSERQTPRLAEGLEIIERNIHVQSQLVEELLDMNRIMTGKMRLDLGPIDPLPVVIAAIASVRPSADARQIGLHADLDPAGGPVQADAARLQQIVWNLLTNAIKFSPAGSQVEISLRRAATHREILVSDTGVGIAPEFLPFVFDRFRQADSSSTRRQGGLGLGLAIVKSLAEMHGGTVVAASAGEGRGATFRVTIPLAEADAGSLAPGILRDPVEDPSGLAGRRILVVDDQPDSLAVLRWVLEENHALVTTASSGSEAILALECQSFDLIISDISMPEMDGLELIQRLRRLQLEGGTRTPAIALTAFARPEDGRRILGAGFDAFIAKPIEPPELIAIVSRHLPGDRAFDFAPSAAML